MSMRSVEVQRIYRNAADEIIRIDDIVVSGKVTRKNTWKLGPRDTEKDTATGWDVVDYGDDVFHANPRRVSITNFVLSTDRVVAEIEMLGGFTSVGAAPNYQSFTWEYGTENLDNFPVVGNTV